MRPEAEAAVREFVAARGPALYRTAYLLVGNAHEAEDLTQATLVQVIDAWDRIQRRDAPELYARRVLVNLAARRWRRLRMHADLMAQQALRRDAPDHAEDTVTRDLVSLAVRSLPIRMRAVVVLRFYDDLSIADTATVLGVSAGTVKSQTTKALTHLRQRLEPPDPDLTEPTGDAGPTTARSRA